MFATVFCGSIFAQEQGGMFISGDIGMNFNSNSMSKAELDPAADGYSYNDNAVAKQTDLSLNLSGAYFIMDGLAVGLSVAMDQEKVTSNSSHPIFIPTGYVAPTNPNEDNVVTTTTTMFGPLVRYYIGETGVFANLSYMMGGTKYKDNQGLETVNASGVTTGYAEGEGNTKKSRLGIGVGYAISLADNVSLTPMFEYHMDSWTVENGENVLDPDDLQFNTLTSTLETVYNENKIKAGGMNFSIGLTIMM